MYSLLLQMYQILNDLEYVLADQWNRTLLFCKKIHN